MTFLVRNHRTNATTLAATLPGDISQTLITNSVGPTLTVEFYNDGTWSSFTNPDNLNTQNGTWLTGTGTSSNYYIRFIGLTEDGPDGLFTGTVDTWQDISTTRTWTATQTLPHDPPDAYSVYGTIQIGYGGATKYILAATSIIFSVSRVPTFGGG